MSSDAGLFRGKAYAITRPRDLPLEAILDELQFD